MRLTCLTLAAGCLWCSGCGRHELEHNAFPLALGIGTDESRSFHMYAAYPDLQGKDAKENVLAKDLYWDGAMDDLLEGTVQMSEGSSPGSAMCCSVTAAWTEFFPGNWS